MLYSGHDYTLLCVLSALGLIQHYESLLGYGSTLSFELWEGIPPPLHFASRSEQSDYSQNCSTEPTSSKRIIRIIQNNAPFKRVDVESFGEKIIKSTRPCTEPSLDGSKVLIQITEEEAYDKLQQLRERFIAEEPHGVAL